jgi:hypothetical protein
MHQAQKGKPHMQDITQPEKGTGQPISSPIPEKRRVQERRKAPSRGFACISTVGWICRREQLRRKDDPDNFNDDMPGA